MLVVLELAAAARPGIAAAQSDGAASAAKIARELYEPLPPFPAEELERRRKAVMQKMGGGVAILLGEPAATTHKRFLQDHNFYYLTGVAVPGAALILDAESGEAQLFLPQLSEMQRQWEGPRLEPGAQAARATGIRSIHPRQAFDAQLRAILAKRKIIYLLHTPPEPPPTSPMDAATAWLEVAEDPWQGQRHRNQRLIELMRERFAGAEIRDLSSILFAARAVLSPLEQDYMRRSGRIGALGVAEAIRSTQPGFHEWEVAAAARYVFDALGQQEDAFAPILASGPNVNVIHYTTLDRKIESSDLVLLDYGSDYGYYTSDVTRTWPANGRFTSEQLAYYTTVQMIRDSVIAAIRPGVTITDLTEIARRVTRARGHADVAWTTRYGYIGHPVGMAVHEPGGAGALMAGMIFNVEPIIDIPTRQWHFRLEDTVLVTATGSEVLTRDVPVEPDAIVRLHAETGVGEWLRSR